MAFHVITAELSFTSGTVTVSEIVKGHPLVVKQGRVKVGNGSLYYEETGTGAPVIFVHGHSLDHRMWDEQFSVLAKKYRVIRYDLRGYGISSSQTEDYQFTHADRAKGTEHLLFGRRLGRGFHLYFHTVHQT